MVRVAAALLVVAVLGGAVMLATRGLAATPAFPCIETAKSGWLTASSEDVVVRVEFGPSDNRFGAALTGVPIVWQALDTASARARAQAFLFPLAGTTHSTSPGKVSVFVVCDGKGDYWHAQAFAKPSYKDCLGETMDASRFACVRRVFSERSRVGADEAAGALADSMHRLATALELEHAPVMVVPLGSRN